MKISNIKRPIGLLAKTIVTAIIAILTCDSTTVSCDSNRAING